MSWQLHYLRLMHMTVMFFLWVSSAPGSNCFGATVSWNPAASCTMPTLLQSSSQWVVPSQWNGCDCDVSVHGTIALTIVQWWCSEIWRLPILQWKWTVWALHTILSGPGTKPRLQFQSAAKATFPSTEPASVLQQPLLQTTSIGGNYAMTLIWWPLWFSEDISWARTKFLWFGEPCQIKSPIV